MGGAYVECGGLAGCPFFESFCEILQDRVLAVSRCGRAFGAVQLGRVCREVQAREYIQESASECVCVCHADRMRIAGWEEERPGSAEK